MDAEPVEGTQVDDSGSPERVDELLERAHEARLSQAGRLLGGIVHEIKNPLAVIQGYAQLLRERISDPDDREDLERLLDESRRLGTLVEDMLGFVRRGQDGAETVDLNRVAESALNLMQHALRQARVNVVANLGDVPSLARGQHGVYVQVLMNLIANALHAMREAGTLHPHLTLRIQDGTTGRVQIVVANNGPPIHAELAERIFTPFVTTRPEGGGTGLGLALCRDILQRYQGDITLDPPSEREPGASFRVDVPRA
ncbi:MAG: hypothetical protein DHS20C15_01520 [Planctomycetota bacterium]|nr:MAG: hypothetical protein DHS20C15_01520 [Planctomycetota bacterium]